jgi:hypothetical protein
MSYVFRAKNLVLDLRVEFIRTFRLALSLLLVVSLAVTGNAQTATTSLR